MRQAGRYMKEYRQLRGKLSFLQLCKTPELACQVTVHAQETLAADAAIIFADILLLLDALGVGLEYVEGGGPVIARPLRNFADLAALPEIEPAESLSYLCEAIRMTRRALKPDIPLIGFAGAPFTLACYLIEGGHSRNFQNTKLIMYRSPELWNALLARLVSLTGAYLNAQAQAGAQVLQIFDTWVGCLSAADYAQFVLPHTVNLVAALRKEVPVIYFGTSCNHLLTASRGIGCAVIGLDWRADLMASWDLLGDVAVQGNLDPCILLADQSFIKLKVTELLNEIGGKPGHIFNLGHGVLPQTDVDNVKYLVELVHTYKG